MIPATYIARVREVDLLALIGRDTRLVRIAATRGGEYAGPCPFCGGEDRFHVQPEVGRWYCRQCTPRGGDAIDYLRRRDGLTFREAVRMLDAGSWRVGAGGWELATRDQLSAFSSPVWQRAAGVEVRRAAWRLEHELAAEPGRAYLKGRGIVREAWQAWELGYTLAWHPRLQGKLPAIVLPWQEGGRVQAVQYRFITVGLAKGDRFSQRRGGKRLLFGLHLRVGRQVLILVEGELNAVSLWQVCHEWADVLSCGSQGGLVSVQVVALARAVASSYRRVFIWLDEMERAVAAVQAIAPANGCALWSEEGLDANDRLRAGSLASWLDGRVDR